MCFRTILKEPDTSCIAFENKLMDFKKVSSEDKYHINNQATSSKTCKYIRTLQ